MPNLQDVADQINARLDQISTNTASTAGNTADIRNELVQTNSRLLQIDATLVNGFANLSQGLFALIQVQIIAAGLLDHNRKQNDTIICELANSNTLLCSILRKLTRQLRSSEAAQASLARIEGISERVHALEAGDVDRQRELLEQVQDCCPPEPVPQEPCPDMCPPPVYRDRQPTGQDWKPLPPPQRPIG
jgi:ABC-type transporter Mla subunit MlaD